MSRSQPINQRTILVPDWLRSAIVMVAGGIAFAGAFVLTQWFFSEFLLSEAADNWLFAGGGRHWPFFLKIPEPARRMFFNGSGDEVNESSLLVAGALAIVSTRLGVWVGEWLRGMRR
jgi:hypothetical protein